MSERMNVCGILIAYIDNQNTYIVFLLLTIPLNYATLYIYIVYLYSWTIQLWKLHIEYINQAFNNNNNTTNTFEMYNFIEHILAFILILMRIQYFTNRNKNIQINSNMYLCFKVSITFQKTNQFSTRVQYCYNSKNLLKWPSREILWN